MKHRQVVVWAIQKGGHPMNRWLIPSMVVLFGVLMLPPLVRAGNLAEFKGGIGVFPVVGGGALNFVRGVQGGLNPWVINKFDARVEENGDIRAEGTGLVLAGGDNIGTPDSITTIAAQLFCRTGPTSFSAHSSRIHPLAADGNFKFTDTLTPVPPFPCTDPALLIRANNSTGVWIAAGIPKKVD